MIATQESLLGRLEAENANEAWREFYRHDWTVLLRYVQALGLRPHQAEEVVQETIVVLLRNRGAFQPERHRGHLGGFLLPSVRRRALAIRRRARLASEVPWEFAHEATCIAIDGPAADDGDPMRSRDALCEEALRRVRDDPGMAPSTFAIFQAYVIERRGASDVARSFGVTENGVYQIKNRLVRRVRREVAAIMRYRRSEGT